MADAPTSRPPSSAPGAPSSRRKVAPPLPSDTPVPPEERTGGIAEVEPFVLPELAALYQRRGARLEALAEQAGDDGGPYLRFLRELVSLQERALKDAPLPPLAMATLAGWLAAETLPTSEELNDAPFWQEIFSGFASELARVLPEKQARRLEEAAQDPKLLSEQAHLLLSGDFAHADKTLAVPLWAVLSLCWAQGAAWVLASPDARKKHADQSATHCPCCGALPAGSLVMTGAREGLRYQQCSLCETRWHKVRSICTVCGESGKLDYWLLDARDAPVEIESCGDCQSYAKIFRLDRHNDLEADADDLATFALDALVEEKGFTRATINPFALPV